MCIVNSVVNDIFERIAAEASRLAHYKRYTSAFRVLLSFTQYPKINWPFLRTPNKTNKEIDNNVLVLLLIIISPVVVVLCFHTMYCGVISPLLSKSLLREHQVRYVHNHITS